MTPQSGEPRTTGPDGRVVRDNGEWAEKKLQFLEEFGPIALKATRAKHTRTYIDLFAGPGLNIPRLPPRTPFEGSPLRALSLCSDSGESFTDAFLINKDIEDFSALDGRVTDAFASGRSRVSRERTRVWGGDANELVTRSLDLIDPRGYVFVFADPTSPNQLPWSTIDCLTQYKAHESVDLYTLFPFGMALRRMASYNMEATEMNAAALTRFYGDESWRECMRHRSSRAFNNEFSRCMLNAYLARLRTRWEYADVACSVRHRNNELYQMLFATSAEAGRKIARWAKRRLDASGPQMTLL